MQLLVFGLVCLFVCLFVVVVVVVVVAWSRHFQDLADLVGICQNRCVGHTCHRFVITTPRAHDIMPLYIMRGPFPFIVHFVKMVQIDYGR